MLTDAGAGPRATCSDVSAGIGIMLTDFSICTPGKRALSRRSLRRWAAAALRQVFSMGCVADVRVVRLLVETLAVAINQESSEKWGCA